MARTADQFIPGQRVRVTQQIPQRDTVWTTTVEGTVDRFEQRKTGSWFAHARHHKLWLDRLIIRKDDGEVVVCNLDPYTRVEVTKDPPPPEAAAAAAPAQPQTS